MKQASSTVDRILSYLDSLHVGGNANVSVDVILMRVSVLTTTELPYRVRQNIREMVTSTKLVYFGLICTCNCHRDEPIGWLAVVCCPDCGRSLTSNISD